MFRLSLREMFALVAASALAMVSLVYASPRWQAFVMLMAMVAAMIAIIGSLVDRGPSRAFAIGFAVGMLGYMLIVMNAQKFTNKQGGEMSGGSLPTSRLLESFYAGIDRSGYLDAKTNERVPATETTTLTGSSPYGGALQTSTGRQVYYQSDPQYDSFMPIGHLWWAFLFGYVGGHFAQYIDKRRAREPVVTV
jgi:hypothetical protein